MNILKPLKHGNVLTEEEALKDIESAPEVLDSPPGTWNTMPEFPTYGQAITHIGLEYAKGYCKGPLHQHNDRTMIRPPTVKEIAKACVEDYETTTTADSSNRSVEDRTFLLRSKWNTCAATINSFWSDKWKINPVSDELITLDKSTEVRYSKLEWNVFSLLEVEGRDFWRILISDDSLYQAYQKIVSPYGPLEVEIEEPSKQYLRNIRVEGQKLVFCPLNITARFLAIK